MKNSQKRTKKLEIKLHEAEEKIIRATFGRMAASVARGFLLGYHVRTAGLKQTQAQAILRALSLHHSTLLSLRQRLEDDIDEESGALLQREKDQFNALLEICSSIFLAEKKAA